MKKTATKKRTPDELREFRRTTLANARAKKSAKRASDAPILEPKQAKAIPQLEVWERRLVNPNQRGSKTIHLKDDPSCRKWELRTINTDVSGRYQEAIYRQGWIPVTRAELADANEIPGLFDHTDGNVRTGPGGVYLLCKMPRAVYDAIAKRKVEISQHNRRSAQIQRENLMARAAEHNPRGADAIAKLKGNITELVETVDLDNSEGEPSLPVSDREASRETLE